MGKEREVASGALDPTLTATSGPGAAARLAPPRRIGHFDVIEELGRGGMGVVYRAHDTSLDRNVAVKVLSSESVTADQRDRFFREARAQAKLSHPNIAHVYFVGEADNGDAFFAMELIDGETLGDKLRTGGPLSASEALRFTRQVAVGLDEALSHGTVHRDIKPSNLMIDRHGTLKILDFGIARQLAATGSAAPDAVIDQTTIAGTPLYAAPEQLRGDPVGFRADVYALGATLHHMLTGAPPFGGDTFEALTELHQTATRPRFERDNVGRRDPTQLDDLVDRMMAKSPEDRFDSYTDLTDAIDFVEPRARRPAGAFIRLSATFVDSMVLSTPFAIFALIVGMATDSMLIDNLIMLSSILAFLAYYVWRQALTGATLGYRVFGIEVIAPDRKRGIGWRRALIRNIAFAGPYVVVSFAMTLTLSSTWPLLVVLALTTLLYVASFIHLILVTRRELAGRTYWDRLSGTQVRSMPS